MALNQYPLNGIGFNSSVDYGTEPFPASQINMILTMSEKNLSFMVGDISIVHSLAGQVSAKVNLSGDISLVLSSDLNMAGLYNGAFLSGGDSIALSMSGDPYTAYADLGDDLLVLTTTGDLTKTQTLGGGCSIVLSMGGDPVAKIFMAGDLMMAMTLDGQVSSNVQSEDDDARTFKRAFKEREFSR